MRQAVMAVAMLALAAMSDAGEGFFSFPFNEEDCVNVIISTPTWRLNTAKRTAADEFRKPTAAELNVGTSYEILIWNEETIPCRNLRPKELVVTDATDTPRTRYPLAPTTAVRANAFGASGAFYTATVRLQRAAVARAFGTDGRLHVITSDGRRTTTFAGVDFADAVDYETAAERKARQDKRDEDDIIAVARRLDKACEPASSSSEAYLQLASAIGEIGKANLTQEKVSELLRPYADCLATKKGTLAEAEADVLLKKIR